MTVNSPSLAPGQLHTLYVHLCIANRHGCNQQLTQCVWMVQHSKAAKFVLFVSFYHFCVYHDTGGISPAFCLESTNAFLSAVCSWTHLATVSRKITKGRELTSSFLPAFSSTVTLLPLPPSVFPWQPGVCKSGMETSNTWWVHIVAHKRPMTYMWRMDEGFSQKSKPSRALQGRKETHWWWIPSFLGQIQYNIRFKDMNLLEIYCVLISRVWKQGC